MPTTRNGKIASLPARLREELNRRLHDGRRGPELLPWLNGLPEVLTVLALHFSEERGGGEWTGGGGEGRGEKITPQNLSEWRQGGYQDWLAKREKVERLKLLSTYCAELSAANPGGSNLPAAVAGGQLLEVLEDWEPEALKALLAEKPGTYIDLLLAMAKLADARSKERVAEQNDRRLAQSDRKLEQSQRVLELAEAKFQRQTVEAYLDWREDARAKEIADSGATKEVKMDRLVQLIFGSGPEGASRSTEDTEDTEDTEGGEG